MLSFFKMKYADPLDVKQGTVDVAMVDEERRRVFMYSVVYDLNQFTGVFPLPCITPEDEPHLVPTSFEGMKNTIKKAAMAEGFKVKLVMKKDLTFADLVESMKADLKDVPSAEKAFLMSQLLSCLGA